MAKKLNKNMVIGLAVLGFAVTTAAGLLMVFQLKQTDPKEFVQRAEALAKDKKWREASTFYGQAYNASKDAQYLVLAGDMQLEDSNEREALKLYRQAVIINPSLLSAHEKSLELLLLIVEMSPRTDNWVDLQKSAQEILAMSPDHPEATYALGISYIGLRDVEPGNEDKGLETLRKAVELAPADVDPSRELSNYLASKGELEEAEAILRKLVEATKEPGRDAALARCLLAIRIAQPPNPRHDESVKLLEEATQVAGTDSEVIADVQYRTGEYWYTRWAEFARAAATPGASAEQQAAVKSEEAEKYFAQAVDSLQKSIATNPDSFEAYRLLAMVYRFHGDNQLAKETLEERIERPIRREGFKAARHKVGRYISLLALAEMHLLDADAAPAGSPEREAAAAKARQYVEFAMAEYPNEPGAHNMLGRVSHTLGKYREAVLDLRKAQDLSAGRPNLLGSYYLADSLLRLGQAGEARSALERVMATQEAGPDIRLLWGQICLQLQRPEEALETAQAILSRYPDYRRAKLLEVQAKEMLGMDVGDLAQLGDDPRILAARAQLMAREGEEAEALALLAPALEADPGNVSLVRAAVTIHHQAGRKDEAKRIVEAALAAKPHDFELGILNLQLSDLGEEEAEKEFLRMVETLPDEFTRAIQRATYYDGRSKPEPARESFHKAAELIISGSTEAARAAGETGLRSIVDRLFQLAMQKKDTAELARLVELAKKQNLDAAEGLSYEGRLLMTEGVFAQERAREALEAQDVAAAEAHRKQSRERFAKALEALKQAIEKFPSSAQTYAQLGEAYLQTERVDDARAALEQAHEKQPLNGTVIKRLAEIALMTGDTGAFADWLTRYGRIAPEDPWYLEHKAIVDAEKNPRDVITRREKRREADPADVQNLYYLADLYTRVGDSDLARQRLDEMLKVRLDERTASLAAQLLRRMNKPDDALRILQRYQREAPPEKRAEAQLLVARHYETIRDFPNADLAFEAAQDISATPTIFASIGRYYFSTNRFAKALEWFDRALGAKDETGTLDRTAVRIVRTEALLRSDRLDDARQEVEALIREFPGNTAVLLLDAEISQAGGRTEEAINKLTKLLNEHPNYQMAAMRRAELQFAIGRWNACISGLENLRALSPSALNYRPRILLAEAYIKAGQEDLALRDLTGIVEQNPAAENVVSALVDIHIRRNEYAKADALITSMLNRQPNSVTWHLEAGTLAALQKDRAKTLNHFAKAAELSGYHPDVAARVLQACSKQNLDAPQRGIEYFEQFIPPGQRTARVTLIYARLLAEVGNDSAALENFLLAGRKAEFASFDFLDAVAVNMLQAFGGPKARELLQQAPSDEVFQRIKQHLLTEVLRETGELEESERIARELLADPMNDREAAAGHLHLARVHEARAQYEEARKAYEEVLKLDPGNVVALNNLAYLLTDKLNRPKEAVGPARQAALLAPRPEVLDTLGWAYLKSGELQEAAAQFMRARTANPDYLPVVAHLGEAYRRMGEFKDAIELFNIVLAAPKGGEFDDYRKMAEEGLQKANSQNRD